MFRVGGRGILPYLTVVFVVFYIIRPGGTIRCCPGEVWNISLRSCQPCSIGFYGPNCTIKCPFPTYGKDCQLDCRCSKSLCSHVDGCNTSNKELSKVSTKEVSSHSGSREPKMPLGAKSSIAHVGHISGKNVDPGKISLNVVYFSPKYVK
ncbi:uncharacterized protein LOC144619682 [Crassostrea virginica]